MRIIDVVQGTPEWLQERSAIPTASEFGQLLTGDGKVRAWSTEMPNTYLARKLAERWLGGPLAAAGNWAMEQGSILESEAIPAVEWETGLSIGRMGLITTDDGRAGCSPDGLVQGRQEGIEIKCPQPEAHVKYLLSGELPRDYIPQVQGSLWVTGFARWHFVSYRRHMPMLHLVIVPDPDWQEAIGRALAEFQERMDAAWQRLCDLNGGKGPQ